MQIASILSPEENVCYVIQKFQTQLPMSVEALSDPKATTAFDKKIKEMSNPKSPDAYAFIEYITSADFQKNCLSVLKPKGTKKKPLSFERLNIMVMAIFKYLETLVEAKKGDKPRMKECLAKWLQVIQAQNNIAVNSQFES